MLLSGLVLCLLDPAAMLLLGAGDRSLNRCGQKRTATVGASSAGRCATGAFHWPRA